MAGKAKERDFTMAEGSDMLGTVKYDVKLPNGNTDSIDIMGPINYEAFVKFLSSDIITDKEKTQAFTFHWRGKEAMAAQKVRLLNDTVVTIPGTSKSLDLMAIPVSVACQAINAHDLGIKVLAAASAALAAENDEDDDEEMDEDTEKAARKNRAWNNARRFLLESGKAIETPDGTLAPAVAGGSDVDVNDTIAILTGVSQMTKRKGRK